MTEDNPYSTKDIATELSDFTGTDVENLIAITEYDDKSHAVRIIVYIDDEDTAIIIKTKVSDKCKACEGTFCRCTATVREVTRMRSLSNSHSLHDDNLLTVLLLVFLVKIGALIK